MVVTLTLLSVRTACGCRPFFFRCGAGLHPTGTSHGDGNPPVGVVVTITGDGVSWGLVDGAREHTFFFFGHGRASTVKHEGPFVAGTFGCGPLVPRAGEWCYRFPRVLVRLRCGTAVWARSPGRFDRFLAIGSPFSRRVWVSCAHCHCRHGWVDDATDFLVPTGSSPSRVGSRWGAGVWLGVMVVEESRGLLPRWGAGAHRHVVPCAGGGGRAS